MNGAPRSQWTPPCPLTDAVHTYSLDLPEQGDSVAVVRRVAAQLLLKTVPKRPVDDLRDSALQAAGKNGWKETFCSHFTRRRRSYFGVCSLPVGRGAPGFEAEVSVQHDLVSEVQVGETVFQIHQAGRRGGGGAP